MIERAKNTMPRPKKGPVVPPPALTGALAIVAEAISTWPGIIATGNVQACTTSPRPQRRQGPHHSCLSGGVARGGGLLFQPACRKAYLLLRESIADLSKRLDPGVFIRVHRSALVNLNFVQALYRERLEDGTLVFTSDQRVKRVKLDAICLSSKADFDRFVCSHSQLVLYKICNGD